MARVTSAEVRSWFGTWLSANQFNAIADTLAEYEVAIAELRRMADAREQLLDAFASAVLERFGNGD